MLMQTNHCGIPLLCVLAQCTAQGHVLKAIDPPWIQAKQERVRSRAQLIRCHQYRQARDQRPEGQVREQGARRCHRSQDTGRFQSVRSGNLTKTILVIRVELGSQGIKCFIVLYYFTAC